MIDVKAQGLKSLQREFKRAPKSYRQAMLRALSTTKRDTKAGATKIAVEVYTAGRNKISQGFKTTKVDRSKLNFKLIGAVVAGNRRGISLIDFDHQGSPAKKNRGLPVKVKVLRAAGFSAIPDSFIKKGRITGKMRIMQYQRSGPQAVIALASSSVADILSRPAVADRLNKFSTKKMSNELARQAAMVFR